jgi:NAD(P)-dependent dehydrogenase (short-subunit alcohol dehydrogenase family)
VSHPSASLEVVPLDLGDLSLVSAAARSVLARHARVDLLVNNAGVMAMPQRATVDGFEMQSASTTWGTGPWCCVTTPLSAAAAQPVADHDAEQGEQRTSCGAHGEGLQVAGRSRGNVCTPGEDLRLGSSSGSLGVRFAHCRR